MDSPSPQHMLEFAGARQGSSKIRRLITIGNVDGWSTLVLGVLSLLGSIIVFSIPGGLLGIAMSFIGWRQLQAVKSLRHLAIDAPRKMALNQSVLCVAICIYLGWSLYSENTAPEDPTIQAAMQQYGFSGLEQSVTVGVYGGGILLSIIVMGSTALYYARKSAALDLYLKQTPQWIVQMQRTSDPL